MTTTAAGAAAQIRRTYTSTWRDLNLDADRALEAVIAELDRASRSVRYADNYWGFADGSVLTLHLSRTMFRTERSDGADYSWMYRITARAYTCR